MTMGCKHIGWLGTLYPLFGWSQGGRVARELGLRIGDRFLTHKHKHIRFLPFFQHHTQLWHKKLYVYTYRHTRIRI